MPEPSATPVPDLLRRDFTTDVPNAKYIGNITYLPVGNSEFLYLVTVSPFQLQADVDQRPVRGSW